MVDICHHLLEYEQVPDCEEGTKTPDAAIVVAVAVVVVAALAANIARVRAKLGMPNDEVELGAVP